MDADSSAVGTATGRVGSSSASVAGDALRGSSSGITGYELSPKAFDLLRSWMVKSSPAFKHIQDFGGPG